MRKLAYILGGILMVLVGSVPLQLSMDAIGKEAYGLTILLMFFALTTAVCGVYLLKESGENYFADK